MRTGGDVAVEDMGEVELVTGEGKMAEVMAGEVGTVGDVDKEVGVMVETATEVVVGDLVEAVVVGMEEELPTRCRLTTKFLFKVYPYMSTKKILLNFLGQLV